jgi:choline dehydrogenase-like flavoprotein
MASALKQYDVCIVGSGAAGGVMAKELSECGAQVVPRRKSPSTRTSNTSGIPILIPFPDVTPWCELQKLAKYGDVYSL